MIFVHVWEISGFEVKYPCLVTSFVVIMYVDKVLKLYNDLFPV